MTQIGTLITQISQIRDADYTDYADNTDMIVWKVVGDFMEFGEGGYVAFLIPAGRPDLNGPKA